MNPSYCLTITGRVQGVSFRYHTMEKARELGIFGYVKNQPDGTVYVEAQGERGALDQLVLWCHQGPSFARVEKVAVEKGKGSVAFSNFEIRYPG
ncbi:acylphosphatase [Desulfocicer niacini]